MILESKYCIRSEQTPGAQDKLLNQKSSKQAKYLEDISIHSLVIKQNAK